MKISVLISGGVDSSVSALLLKEKGYDLVGIHLHCFDFCNPQDAEDARKVAEILNIPFYVFDLTEEFEDKVINYIIRTYEQGLTPNPDVYCNQFIKFGVFFDKAIDLGYDFVASGHYAKAHDGHLLTSKDKEKDQTYFLWKVEKEKFSKIIFPVGDFLKTEVREIAKKYNLPTAEKKESMGICFVGQVKLREFLSQYLKPKEGKIIDTQGRVLGTHPGYFYFTEGQRHGLNIKVGGGPYYVAQKIPEENLIIVAKEDDPLLYTQKIEITEVNILEKEIFTTDKRGYNADERGYNTIHGFNGSNTDNTDKIDTYKSVQNPYKSVNNKSAFIEEVVEVRFRHRQPLVKAILRINTDLTQINTDKNIRVDPRSNPRLFTEVEFLEPQKMVAPGQSIVFYKDELVLGGGIILKRTPLDSK